MSILKKERIIYIAGIALFALTMIALCFPFFTVGVYSSDKTVKVAESVTYLGWQLFNLVNPFRTTFADQSDPSTEHNLVASPIGSEAAFVMFTALLIIFSFAAAVFCGFGLFLNYKKGGTIGKKWINLFMIIYVGLSFVILILYFLYVKYLNTAEMSETLATSWSAFAFKNLTGVTTKMGPVPFIFAVIGCGATVTSLIFTMQIQDNSILYPYKKRQVYSAIITIVLCVGMFFLPFIDYFYSTEYLSYSVDATNFTNTLFEKLPDGTQILDAIGLEDISKNFVNGVGWEMLTTSSGHIDGYYKILFTLIFVVAGGGIIYAIANLLGACEIIRFNFSRKYINIICLTLMILGILLWVGSLAFSIGVNARLETVFQLNPEWFALAYPDGYFPQTECTIGAWLSMVPGIIGFISVFALNAFED